MLFLTTYQSNIFLHLLLLSLLPPSPLTTHPPFLPPSFPPLPQIKYSDVMTNPKGKAFVDKLTKAFEVRRQMEPRREGGHGARFE